MCSPHPGLGHHDDGDDHYHHPDVNDDENVVNMSCHGDPNAEDQSITCALCSPHPGLGHDDQHQIPDDENVVHMSCHGQAMTSRAF